MPRSGTQDVTRLDLSQECPWSPVMVKTMVIMFIIIVAAPEAGAQEQELLIWTKLVTLCRVYNEELCILWYFSLPFFTNSTLVLKCKISKYSIQNQDEDMTVIKIMSRRSEIFSRPSYSLQLGWVCCCETQRSCITAWLVLQGWILKEYNIIGNRKKEQLQYWCWSTFLSKKFLIFLFWSVSLQ